MKNNGQSRNAGAVITSICACVAGALLLVSRPSEPLTRLSFDIPFLFRPAMPSNNIVIVAIDETTYSDPELNAGKYRAPFFDRSAHAKFLKKLSDDGARLVVFDIHFIEETDEDSLLASAITNYHGKVVLPASMEALGAEFDGRSMKWPAPALRDLPGVSYGLVDIQWEPDLIIRKFPREVTNAPSLPVAAAEAFGVPEPLLPTPKQRYVAFYGDQGTFASEPYHFAFRKANGYFKDKIVFIGGKPKVEVLDAPSDAYFTPFARLSGARMSGVEIHATMFLNLLRQEWLTRAGLSKDLIAVLAIGLGSGFILSRLRPLPGLAVAAGLSLTVAAAAIFIFWFRRTWFDWAPIAFGEIPVAWTVGALLYSARLKREKETMQKELHMLKVEGHLAGLNNSESTVLVDVKPVAPPDGAPVIRDFELLRFIGDGAFGQVWLARSITGAYRAIKLIYRKNFSDQRDFEREFEGVQRFEPISRTHPGWINILHVGKDEDAGFFYYVMDPADDLETGAVINPARYTPKSLSKLIPDHRWLPVEECISIGIHLAGALAALHELGKVHRDIKPSNIIFAKGLPKLADIGLVSNVRSAKSFRGTEGFIPPEGPGTPQADIFSLGRTLYQVATGCEPEKHPSLPTSLKERADRRELMRLMAVINKACETSLKSRYSSARAMLDDLRKLASAMPQLVAT